MFEMLKSHTHRRPSARELVGGDGIVLDVRTREEFASGHVEGAINAARPRRRSSSARAGT